MNIKPFNHSTGSGLLAWPLGLSTCLGLVLAATVCTTSLPVQAQLPVLYNCTAIRYDSSAEPLGPIIQASDGYFYGFDASFGRFIFKMDKDGAYTPLQTLPAGYRSFAQLVEGLDGSIYGVAKPDGSSDYGMVFKVARDGSALTPLHYFDVSAGWSPRPELAAGGDGYLYGVAIGNSGNYTIYKVSADGNEFITLGPPDGLPDYWSVRSLITGSDGLIYGLTSGLPGGTVFKIDATGSFTTLQSFSTAEELVPEFITPGVDQSIYGVLQNVTYMDLGSASFFQIGANGALTTWIPSAFFVWEGISTLRQGSDGLLNGMQMDTYYSNRELEVMRFFLTDPQQPDSGQIVYTIESQIGGIPSLSVISESDGSIYICGVVNGRYVFFQLNTPAQACAAVEQQLASAQQNIANLNAQVSQLQGQVATLTSENAALQNQLKPPSRTSQT